MFKKALVLLLLCGALCANGYKEFEWGMSTGQVSASVTDLRKNNLSTPPLDEFYVFAKILFGQLVDFDKNLTDQKLFAPDKKREAYISKVQNLLFYFEEDRLIGVAVDFGGVNPYNDLVQKYGSRTRTRFLRGNNYSYDACAWVTAERVIVYSGLVLKPAFGNVYYFDTAWIKDIQNRLQTPKTISEKNLRLD